MELVRETLGNFFAYDSRFANSLIPLLKNPGQLSLDYIAGKKASHIHPMRLYLAISFILFLLISIANRKAEYSKVPQRAPVADKAEKESASAGSTLEIDEETIKKAKESRMSMFVLFFTDIKRNGTKNYSEATARYNLEESMVNRIIFEKAFKLATLNVSKFAAVLSEKMPIIVFMFLPFFVILLNILHLKKDILYIEHLIFAFHVQSALFLISIVGTVVGLFYAKGGAVIGNVTLLFIFPIYLYLALKKFYGYPTHLKAILMFFVINLTYGIAAWVTMIVGILATLIFY